MSPRCLQTAHKQVSEPTLFANNPRPLLINGFSPLDLADDRVHGHGTQTEPACPTSPSGGNCPKKDSSSSQTETPGRLVMQGIASYDCPSKRLKRDSRSCSPLSGVVCLHGVWVLAVVCGLFASIVGPFGGNVVPQHLLFALIVG
jgi:hypothetical protein